MAFNSIGIAGYTPPGLAFNAGKAILGKTGLLGGGGGGNFDDSFYQKRAAQISEFSNQLAQQRVAYKGKLEQLQSNAFNRFVPDYEAQLAGRGLQVSGGAYGSGLGRESAKLQGQLEEALAAREQQDAYKVEDLRGDLSGQWGQASTGAQMGKIARGNAQQDALMGGLGSFAGQMALNAVMPGAGTIAGVAGRAASAKGVGGQLGPQGYGTGSAGAARGLNLYGGNTYGSYYRPR